MPKSKTKPEPSEVEVLTDVTSDEESKNKSKSKMSVTLSVLTKFIKPYSGDRESLPAFLTNCENAISLASTEQQNVLCKFILSQLEGKAQLACCLKTFNEWSEIKIFLKTTFGEKKHSTHLLVDLQNCKQLPSEDVTQYSLRIEACLTRIQSDIHYSCENDKELIGRLAAMEELALNTFLLGMNNSFSHIVRCRNPRSLSEAITHAIEEEKLFNLTRMSQRTIKECSVCHKTGHSASDCYKNKPKFSPKPYRPIHFNNTNNSNNNANFNTNFNNPNSNFNSKICTYCKNRGHLINECRKLKYKNQFMSQSQQVPSSSGARAPNNATNNYNNQSNVHNFTESYNDAVADENSNLN